MFGKASHFPFFFYLSILGHIAIWRAVMGRSRDSDGTKGFNYLVIAVIIIDWHHFGGFVFKGHASFLGRYGNALVNFSNRSVLCLLVRKGKYKVTIMTIQTAYTWLIYLITRRNNILH